MILVYFGTDVYGAVARVDSTTIATKFAMVQFLPIWPQKSYYYGGVETGKGQSMPMLFQTSQIIGLPLARCYWPSIRTAYVRGIAGALFLLGTPISLIGGYNWISGGRMDDFARMLLTICLSMLILGTFLGILSYVAVPRANSRDTAIRRACTKILGVAADPAKLDGAIVDNILDFIRTSQEDQKDCNDVTSIANLEKSPDDALYWWLVIARAEIAKALRTAEHERTTDELLSELKRRGLLT